MVVLGFGSFSLASGSLSAVKLRLRVTVSPCKRATEDLARPSMGFSCSVFARLTELCRISVMFALLEFGVRGPLLLERMRLMAAAAEPLCSWSAFLTNSFRASASHQNSHARESLDLPLGMRRRPTAGSMNRPELKESLRPAALKLRRRPLGRLSDDVVRSSDRGGDGDDSSPVSSLAAPSDVIDNRTFDLVRFSDVTGTSMAVSSFLIEISTIVVIGSSFTISSSGSGLIISVIDSAFPDPGDRLLGTFLSSRIGNGRVSM